MTAAKPISRKEALAKLRALEPELRAQGVASLYLFGSVARDEAGRDSDIDVFADLDAGRSLGWDYFGIGPFIEDRLGRRVDFMSRGSLHEMLRPRIEQSAVRVF